MQKEVAQGTSQCAAYTKAEETCSRSKQKHKLSHRQRQGGEGTRAGARMGNADGGMRPIPSQCEDKTVRRGLRLLRKVRTVGRGDARKTKLDQEEQETEWRSCPSPLPGHSSTIIHPVSSTLGVWMDMGQRGQAGMRGEERRQAGMWGGE